MNIIEWLCTTKGLSAQFGSKLINVTVLTMAEFQANASHVKGAVERPHVIQPVILGRAPHEP